MVIETSDMAQSLPKHGTMNPAVIHLEYDKEEKTPFTELLKFWASEIQD